MLQLGLFIFCLYKGFKLDKHHQIMKVVKEKLRINDPRHHKKIETRENLRTEM